MRVDTTGFAKAVMKLSEVHPLSPNQDVGTCQEIFRHERFTHASAEERRQLMLLSARKKYEEEIAYPWDNYFGMDLFPLLQGKAVLDLGCFNGGRSIAWFERYRLSRLIGFDVSSHFASAANLFAAAKNANARFAVARGEEIPLENDCVDAVVSFDVFEHVQDVKRVLAECYRVLRSGGRLFVVFPSYYHPVEHHLAMVTRLPGIQYFFSGTTLTRAYYEILQERGEEARWYRRTSPNLEPWEKGNTINGTTVRAFKKHISDGGWKIIKQVFRPIGSIGRYVSKKKGYRLMSYFFTPLALVPGLQEIFLHRATFILEKP